MLQPESSKTLILCRLFDMTRKEFPAALVVLWTWFVFCSLGAWALCLINLFHCGNVGVCYRACAVSALEASSEKLVFLSPNSFEKVKYFDDGWEIEGRIFP